MSRTRQAARPAARRVATPPLAERRRRALEARRAPAVLRAAGVKIERMSAEKLRALAGHHQTWQRLAWGYRDMIGELRSALKFRAQAISRVRFFVAEIINDDDEPVAVSCRNEVDKEGKPTERAQTVTLPDDICAAAEAELNRLPLDAGDAFLGIWSENFDVAGECWLWGHINPDTGQEEWEIRSVLDVQIQGESVTIRDALGQPRAVNLAPDSGEELYRLWNKHAAHPHLADSSLNACMDSLEDITLIGREMRAASRSRIGANGVWFLPDSLATPRNTLEDDDQRNPQEAFMDEFTASILAPISNEGDPGAVAPIVITGHREDINAIRTEKLAREDSPTLIAKQQHALARMGQSIEVPPEVVTGMSDVNHWTAWQIDASTYRYYLEPGIRLMADSLTSCFLRAALKTFPPEQVAKLRIWFDAGSITENPNRRQDALDALDKMLISPKTGRAELGFNEGDAPTPEEVMQMIAARQGFDAATAARVLTYIAQQEGANVPDLPTVDSVPAPRQIGQPTPPAEQGDATGVGGTGAPEGNGPNGIQAAARSTQDAPETPPLESTVDPAWQLDSAIGQELATIEVAVRDRILLAADKELRRALERGGNRLRSKAQRNPELTASLRTLPVTRWAMTMGRDQAFALGADLRFLLKDAFTKLGENFTEWIGTAVDQVISRVLRFLGLKRDSRKGRAAHERMRAAFMSRVPNAWNALHVALERRAEALMFDGEGEPLADGEMPDLLVSPDLVRTALGVIGGLPETAAGVDDTGRIPTGEAFTGLTDGETVTGELDRHGIVPFGREWKYNVALARNTFEPHYDLDGERFLTWHDDILRTPPEYAWVGPFFRPKDHRGCLCSTAVTYAVPTLVIPPEAQTSQFGNDSRDYNTALADQLRERLAQPSQSMAYTIELAESDDRAGRKGTVAQRTRDEWLAVQQLKNQFLNGE